MVVAADMRPGENKTRTNGERRAAQALADTSQWVMVYVLASSIICHTRLEAHFPALDTSAHEKTGACRADSTSMLYADVTWQCLRALASSIYRRKEADNANCFSPGWGNHAIHISTGTFPAVQDLC